MKTDDDVGVVALRGAVVLVLLVAVPDIGGSRRAWGQAVTLGQVMDNVRSNEAVFDNIDIEVTESYRLRHDDGGTEEVNGRKVITHERELSTTKYVRQNGKIHQEKLRDITSTSNEHLERFQIRLFDGMTTRALQAPQRDAPGKANKSAGRKEDGNGVRPHMLLIKHQAFGFPLSAYLTGRRAVEAVRTGGARLGNFDIDVEYNGPELVDGLRCHRVTITHILRDRKIPYYNRILWLAEERNYIPAQMESYTFKWSEDLPLGKGSVEEWKEVQPGIWCPSLIRVVSYDPLELEARGRQKLLWEWEYHVNLISLNPDYPPSYFSDLDIPDGTAVYYVNNGKITSSYRQGQPGTTPSSRFRPMLVAISGGLLLLVLGILIWHRRGALA